MDSGLKPERRAATYVLALLGLVPFVEIAYVAGPKALLSVAEGLILFVVAVGLPILTKLAEIRALEPPSNDSPDT